MKAITIIQPWATLIAIGAKQFETRSWSTKHCGKIAIHAGKKIDREACEQEKIKAALAKHGYTADNLPIGSIIATAYLYDTHKITNIGYEFASSVNYQGEITADIDGDEFAFGWYEKGRFAWELRNIQQLPEPIPAKGQQGIWNWDEGI